MLLAALARRTGWWSPSAARHCSSRRQPLTNGPVIEAKRTSHRSSVVHRILSRALISSAPIAVSDTKPEVPPVRKRRRGGAADREPSWREIQPATGVLRGLRARELWDYRYVVSALVSRQMKARHKQAVLGASWSILQPLLQVVVFTVIFGNLAGLSSDGVPYPVFLIAGLVVWTYISSSVLGATQRLVLERDLVTKIYFPRVLAPIASVVPPLLDLAVGLAVTVALMAAYGVSPDIQILLLPVWIAAAVFVALSAGLLLSALNVQYRDVGYVLGFFVQLWLFVSPVVFSSMSVDGIARIVLALNPVTGIVDGMRYSLLDAAPPPPIDLLSLASACVLAVAGLIYFQSVERRFADLV